MSKEELIQKEITRILAENPENPAAVLRAKRKQELAPTQAKTGEKLKATPLTDTVQMINKLEK